MSITQQQHRVPDSEGIRAVLVNEKMNEQLAFLAASPHSMPSHQLSVVNRGASPPQYVGATTSQQQRNNGRTRFCWYGTLLLNHSDVYSSVTRACVPRSRVSVVAAQANPFARREYRTTAFHIAA